jgi:hypothetical protein
VGVHEEAEEGAAEGREGRLLPGRLPLRRRDLLYPNPDGLYASMNPFVAPFNRG